MKHLRTWLVVTLLTLGGTLGACTLPETFLEKVDLPTEEERVKAMFDAAEYASKAKNPEPLRCYALESIGKMRTRDSEVIDKMAVVLKDTSAPSSVRQWAAWALGESRTDLAYQQVVGTMDIPMDEPVAYYVLDALGKLFPLKVRQDEDVDRVTEQLNSLAAKQSQTLPRIYHVVLQRIASLPVLVRVMDKALAPLNSGNSRERLLKAYNAAFAVLNYMHLHQKELTADLAASRTMVTDAFDHALAGLDPDLELLSLVIAWYSAYLAGDQDLAPLAAEQLAAQVRHRSPRVRLIVSWGLTRMQLVAPPARAGLREKLLPQESDDRVLELLSKIHDGKGRPGQLQLLFGIQPRMSDTPAAPNVN